MKWSNRPLAASRVFKNSAAGFRVEPSLETCTMDGCSAASVKDYEMPRILRSLLTVVRLALDAEPAFFSLSTITPEDCSLADGLMSKYSCYEHSQSAEAPVFIPEEAELRRDIEALKSWREGIKVRRSKP